METDKQEGNVVYGAAVARPARRLMSQIVEHITELPIPPEQAIETPSIQQQLLGTFYAFAADVKDVDFSTGQSNRAYTRLEMRGSGYSLEGQLRGLALDVIDLADRLRPIVNPVPVVTWEPPTEEDNTSV